MSNDLTKERAEAVQEVTSSMLTAAGKAMERHGNDPHSEVILGAAVAMFVDKVDRQLSPGFKARLVALLTNC